MASSGVVVPTTAALVTVERPRRVPSRKKKLTEKGNEFFANIAPTSSSVRSYQPDTQLRREGPSRPWLKAKPRISGEVLLARLDPKLQKPSPSGKACEIFSLKNKTKFLKTSRSGGSRRLPADEMRKRGRRGEQKTGNFVMNQYYASCAVLRAQGPDDAAKIRLSSVEKVDFDSSTMAVIRRLNSNCQVEESLFQPRSDVIRWESPDYDPDIPQYPLEHFGNKKYGIKCEGRLSCVYGCICEALSYKRSENVEDEDDDEDDPVYALVDENLKRRAWRSTRAALPRSIPAENEDASAPKRKRGRPPLANGTKRPRKPPAYLSDFVGEGRRGQEARVAKRAEKTAETAVIQEQPEAPVEIEDKLKVKSRSPTPLRTLTVKNEASTPSETATVENKSPTSPEVLAVDEKPPPSPKAVTVIKKSPTPPKAAVDRKGSLTPPETKAVRKKSPTPPETAAVQRKSPTPPKTAAVRKKSPTPPKLTAVRKKSQTHPKPTAVRKKSPTPPKAATVGEKPSASPKTAASPKKPTKRPPPKADTSVSAPSLPKKRVLTPRKTQSRLEPTVVLERLPVVEKKADVPEQDEIEENPEPPRDETIEVPIFMPDISIIPFVSEDKPFSQETTSDYGSEMDPNGNDSDVEIVEPSPPVSPVKPIRARAKIQFDEKDQGKKRLTTTGTSKMMSNLFKNGSSSESIMTQKGKVTQPLVKPAAAVSPPKKMTQKPLPALIPIAPTPMTQTEQPGLPKPIAAACSSVPPKPAVPQSTLGKGKLMLAQSLGTPKKLKPIAPAPPPRPPAPRTTVEKGRLLLAQSLALSSKNPKETFKASGLHTLADTVTGVGVPWLSIGFSKVLDPSKDLKSFLQRPPLPKNDILPAMKKTTTTYRPSPDGGFVSLSLATQQSSAPGSTVRSLGFSPFIAPSSSSNSSNVNQGRSKD